MEINGNDLSLTPNLVCCKTSSAVCFLVVFIFDCKTLTRLMGLLPSFKVFKPSLLLALPEAYINKQLIKLNKTS
jgi:hypothetical protein